MEQPIRIQVIEDEQNIRENLQELLEAKGYIVRASPDGQQGVLDAIDFKPNLIICDIMMPKMNGHEVLDYVRKTSSVQNTPFIFLTAKVDKDDIRLGMNQGADDYLTKPFTYKDLLNAVETRLKRQQNIISEYSKIKHELDTSVFANYYHEFNTPLHGILGGLNLMLTSRSFFSDSEIHDLLDSILKSGLRLNHSLANLMLFEEIKRAEVYPELLSTFSKGVSKEEWVQKVEKEVVLMCKEVYDRTEDLVISLEACGLKVNQDYLQRIILELTDNALKFSKKGQRVTIVGSREEAKYKVEVKDEGIGFELTSLDDIAPFKQFNRKKFEQQGLGIGLYLIKQLTEFNSGDLKIVSTPSGSTVAVTLPLTIQD